MSKTIAAALVIAAGLVQIAAPAKAAQDRFCTYLESPS